MALDSEMLITKEQMIEIGLILTPDIPIEVRPEIGNLRVIGGELRIKLPTLIIFQIEVRLPGNERNGVKQ